MALPTVVFPFDLEVTMEQMPIFGVGECVQPVRDLPGVRAHAAGVVRGVSTNSSGARYAIRFAATMRIVAECDLCAIDEAE